jgi:hypothetical protein
MNDRFSTNLTLNALGDVRCPMSGVGLDVCGHHLLITLSRFLFRIQERARVGGRNGETSALVSVKGLVQHAHVERGKPRPGLWRCRKLSALPTHQPNSCSSILSPLLVPGRQPCVGSLFSASTHKQAMAIRLLKRTMNGRRYAVAVGAINMGRAVSRPLLMQVAGIHMR